MDLNMKINYEDKCLYCTRIIKGLNDFNRDQHIQACKKKMEHLKIIKVWCKWTSQELLRPVHHQPHLQISSSRCTLVNLATDGDLNRRCTINTLRSENMLEELKGLELFDQNLFLGSLGVNYDPKHLSKRLREKRI